MAKDLQLQKKNTTDLMKLLKEKRAELQKFRFSIAGSKSRNVREGRNVKRDIARILTELRSRNS